MSAEVLTRTCFFRVCVCVPSLYGILGVRLGVLRVHALSCAYVMCIFFSLGNIGTAQPWWLGFWYHTLSENCITIFFFLRTSEYFPGKMQRRPFVFYISTLSVCEK